MSHGILMSKKGSRAVLLTKDGVFKKVKLRKSADISIGEEVFLHHLSKKTVYERPRWLAMVAICLSLLFLFVLSGGMYEPRAAAAYVSFDVNPSVEASIDGNLQIIKIRPLNKAAAALLGEINQYKYMPLELFTKKLAMRMKSEGYFSDHPEVVVTTTIEDHIDNEKKSKILSGISHALKNLKNQQVFVSGEGTIRTMSASEEKRNEAQSEGLSTGKYLIYQEAVDENQAISVSDAKSMTVKEIDHFDKKTVSEVQNGKKQSSGHEKVSDPLKHSSHNNHSIIHKGPSAIQNEASTPKKSNEKGSDHKHQKKRPIMVKKYHSPVSEKKHEDHKAHEKADKQPHHHDNKIKVDPQKESKVSRFLKKRDTSHKIKAPKRNKEKEKHH